MSAKNNKIIYFADFFAGVGGFHHAIKNVSRNKNIKFECKTVSEIDNSAKKIYASKFNFDINSIKDINDIDPKKDMKDVELVFCGFPCQTFSTAGNRKGFADEMKGMLIFKVLDIIKNSNVKVILLENVKYLISHDKGITYKVIIDEFRKIGFKTTKQPLIISPTDLGIPQNRERVFIPLIHESIEKNEYLKDAEKPKSSKLINAKSILEKKVDDKYYLSEEKQNILIAWEEFVEHFRKEKKRTPVIWLDELLNNKYITKSNSTEKEWYKKYMSSMNKFYKENKVFIDQWENKYSPLKWKLRRDKKLEWQAGLEVAFKDAFLQERQSGLRFRRPNSFPTLVATVQTPIIYDKKGWRYLTPKEASKLQNLPEHSNKLCNEFQLYKQYGNSVNVKVVEWVIENYLWKYLEAL